MKKFLAIILGALFVLSFAASAFAIHAEIPSETQAVVAKGTTQITIDGELRVRGWYTNNLLDDAIPGDYNSAAWYDQRVRLAVDAKVSPNLEGYIQLESENSSFNPQQDKYVWGDFNSKPTTLSILQAWILYSGQGLFGFPSGLKIGHMPLYLGQKEFFDHSKFGDDAIVFFMLPTKEIEIDLLTIKLAGEGVPYNIPTFGLVVPSNCTGAGTSNCQFDNTDDLDAYVGIITYKMDPNNTFGINYTYLNQSDLGLSHQNIGAVASGNISGFLYDFTGDFQFGSVDALGQDFGGWQVQAGLGYQLDPVKLRIKGGYGSGDGDPNDGDDDQYETYLSADQYGTLVYGYNMITAAGRRYSGISNTAYVNLGVDYNATKDITASLDGYRVKAAKANPAVAGTSNKDAGWEIDGKLAFNLAKNLKYVMEGGWFFTGKLYGDADDVTVLKHTLTLSF